MEPTQGQTAESLADVWQHASSKYDAPRQAILKEVDRVGHQGPFLPDWARFRTGTCRSGTKTPSSAFHPLGCLRCSRLRSEWYPRQMYREGTPEYKHHLATYGPLTKFGYKDFIPEFKAEHYDPQAWAALFKESGAKYVVPVFEHHDGFQMYDSALSDWTAVKMGPHRDLVGDLADAVRAQGLHLGASSHRVEHDWLWMAVARFPQT